MKKEFILSLFYHFPFAHSDKRSCEVNKGKVSRGEDMSLFLRTVKGHAVVENPWCVVVVVIIE